MTISSRNKLPLIISGGGIGGLACALALAQRQFSVVVCEQAPEFGEVGAGLQVAPNALAVLDALGIGGEVKKHALLIERMVMMDGISGEEISNIPCDEIFRERFGNPYALAHRADVHGALLEACRAAGSMIELRTNCRVVSYTISDNGVIAKLENGNKISGSALIGADGIRSNVRSQLFNDGDPKSVGAVIYRAIIPASKMPVDLQKPFPTLWAGPGAHLIYYPIRDWSQFNVGATVLKPIQGVIEGDAGVDEVIEKFSNWADIPLSVVHLSSRYQRFLIRHKDPIDNWSEGVVTLLGDSAHPMVQYLAQGAAMALEDAICLADQVDWHDGNFVDAFKEYQTIRIVRTARVQISSLLFSQIYHAEGVERLVRNSIFEGRSPKEYYDRLAWVFTAPNYVKSWPVSTPV